jgi:hypothetical protein
MPLDGSLPLARSAQPVSTEVPILSKEAQAMNRKRSSGRPWRIARVVMGKGLSTVNSRDLTRQIKSDTADILRGLERLLTRMRPEGHPPLTEARRLLSDAIAEAETSDVMWAEGPNGILRVEKTSNGLTE